MMTNRNATLDVARGFAVFTMPLIHAVLIYSDVKVQQGALGEILAFFAEWIDAPAFMMLMGVSIAISKQKTPIQIVNKSIKLFALAYILNFLKFILPIIFGTMPKEFLLENNIPIGSCGIIQLSVIGDILQLASFGYLTSGLLHKVRHYQVWAFFIALLVILVSPSVWKIVVPKNFAGHILGLFNGDSPEVFFPVFPWIAYALTGLSIGSFFGTKKNFRFYLVMFFAGCYMIITGWLLSRSEPAYWESNFYRMGPGGTLCHLGAVFVWLCLCRMIIPVIKRGLVFIFFNWCSKNITQLYVVQWTLVFWLMPIFGYHHLGIIASCIAMGLIVTLTLFTVYLWKKIGPSTSENKHNKSITIL